MNIAGVEVEGKLLYGRRNTAKLLDISLRSVDYLIADGRIATVKIGRRTLITAKSLNEFAGFPPGGSVKPVDNR